ncbi:MAG TPA: ribose 5-phosphate isomerase B [Bacteroidales bacterium]|nr:ribose 5-phosphate isomerase B [Bacteroidales bacterium]
MVTIRKVGLACDHAGYPLKEAVKQHLKAGGYEVVDFGTDSDKSVDYADFAHPLAEAVEQGELDRGITLCGSGNGISMVANKHQGIRAAICWNEEITRLAREHNDANVCSLPARFLSEDEARRIVDLFLSAGFEGGRHKRRIDKIPYK